MAPVPYTPEIPDNNIALETGEDNDDKPRKRNAVKAIKQYDFIILINLGKNNRCYKYK